MTHSNIRFIGMDVHKDSIEIAIAEDDLSGGVGRFGAIGGTRDVFNKVLRKWMSQGDKLHFRYEEGPCGYELYRLVIAQGHQCTVAGPSLIPKKAGDKVKMESQFILAWNSFFNSQRKTISTLVFIENWSLAEIFSKRVPVSRRR